MDSGILRALGIESDADAAKLVSLFVVGEEEDENENENEEEKEKETENNDENNNNEEGEEEGKEKKTKVKLIDPAQVMDTLTAYLRMRNAARAREAENDEEGKNATRREKGKDKERERGMSDEAVKEYWERIANVIPEPVTHIWERLEQEMVKYNQILKDRVNLLQGNENLRQQNDEMKVLLNQYLNAKINEELIVPPVSMPSPPQRKNSSSSSSRNSPAGRR